MKKAKRGLLRCTLQGQNIHNLILKKRSGTENGWSTEAQRFKLPAASLTEAETALSWLLHLRTEESLNTHEKFGFPFLKFNLHFV